MVLQGGVRAKERRAALDHLAAIPDDEERLVLATGRYVGEGLDDARLDTLFLALPIAWKGTLVQYAGRLSRLHPQKTEVRIYDYVDHRGADAALGCSRSDYGAIERSGTGCRGIEAEAERWGSRCWGRATVIVVDDRRKPPAGVEPATY